MHKHKNCAPLYRRPCQFIRKQSRKCLDSLHHTAFSTWWVSHCLTLSLYDGLQLQKHSVPVLAAHAFKWKPVFWCTFYCVVFAWRRKRSVKTPGEFEVSVIDEFNTFVFISDVVRPFSLSFEWNLTFSVIKQLPKEPFCKIPAVCRRSVCLTETDPCNKSHPSTLLWQH